MADKHHYKGLTDAQVFESRQKYGENSLSSVEGEPLWKQFLEKFTDPIIIILLVALVFSFGVSTYEYVVHNEGFDAKERESSPRPSPKERGNVATERRRDN